RPAPPSAVQRLGKHLRASVRPVAHRHAPRLAAHLTILHVLLGRPAARVKSELVRLAAVGARDDHLRLGRAVFRRNIIVVDVIRPGVGTFHKLPYGPRGWNLSAVRSPARTTLDASHRHWRH